ncbi:glycoside hydrolase family 5 protein [Sphingobium yanoikuyae]|uniref:glycoside hydrolase family 5 protein n=1 Tax=Sphingobium yanoikuyae TaxID=13690 RepID=UPI00293C9147|nr:cellulase family glycosylhydrolase [Sphingobium yanoikuyae]MDV3482260.1 cellulase family glycosylhydrolase [Sphingobium yanoikuyae]
MISRRAILAGLAVPSFSPKSVFAKPDSGLVVSGNRLVDNGKVVRLRGVAVGDLLKPKRPYLYPYAAISKAWHANAVRISVHPGYWNADVTGSRERVRRNVAAARAAGLYVLLCWHAIGFPGRFTRSPHKEYHSRADAFDASLQKMNAFWKEMAEFYKGDSRVLFELFNEPILNLDNLENDYLNWHDLAAVYEHTINTIIRPRAANVAICGGNRFSYDLRGAAATPLQGRNVAYAWHVYPRQGKSTRDDWCRRLAGIQDRYPVLVTEWGFVPAGPANLQGSIAEFGDPLMEFLDESGISWFAYSFSGFSQPAILDKDWRTSTYFGKFVAKQLER